MSRIGTNPTPMAWGQESGYQTDSDGGLRLLGHRYYDSRTGRFISQDPAGDGNNWYAYCGNDPMGKVDPTGLLTQQEAEDGQAAYNRGDPGLYDFYSVTNGDYANATYMYTKSIGFQNISFLSVPPSMFMNFPGNSGSHYMTQPLKAAEVEYQRTKYHLWTRGLWFAAHVGKGSVWDLKKDVQRSSNPLLWFDRDNAGNFMYGATGTKAGFTTEEVLYGAGYAQARDAGLIDALSHALTHFDDQQGQADIAAGIQWVHMGQPIHSVLTPSSY